MSGGESGDVELFGEAAVGAHGTGADEERLVRDAKLQDELDTIDFNLQMGRITQSSAISAMQQILKTANMTRQQRRDLLLKIKGMKDSMANDQWNFGDIKLPTPYQMRRYVTQEKNKRDDALKSSVYATLDAGSGGAGARSAQVHNNQTNQNFYINGVRSGKGETEASE